jgi:hypothetical protein
MSEDAKKALSNHATRMFNWHSQVAGDPEAKRQATAMRVVDFIRDKMRPTKSGVEFQQGWLADHLDVTRKGLQKALDWLSRRGHVHIDVRKHRRLPNIYEPRVRCELQYAVDANCSSQNRQDSGTAVRTNPISINKTGAHLDNGACGDAAGIRVEQDRKLRHTRENGISGKAPGIRREQAAELRHHRGDENVERRVMAALGPQGFEILEDLNSRDGGRPYSRLIAACRNGIDQAVIEAAQTEYLWRLQRLAEAVPVGHSWGGKPELPTGRWMVLLQTWKAAPQQARDLADHLVAVAGHRRAHLDQLFDRMEKRIRWDGKRRIMWLRQQADKLATDPAYWPSSKKSRPDLGTKEILAALQSGSRTKDALIEVTGKTAAAIASITQSMCASGEIVRLKPGVYALPSPGAVGHVSGSDAVFGVLKAAGREMTTAEIVTAVGKPRTAVDAALFRLRESGTVITVRRGVFALARKVAAG